jgi:hypothetical protein
VKERCDQSLVKLVEEYQEVHQTALPAHDVVMLAFMLLDALTSIHEYAKSFHLHVQPVNVLLEASGAENEASTIGSGPKSIRLANIVFGPGRLPVSLAGKISAGAKSAVNFLRLHGMFVLFSDCMICKA